MTKLIDLPGSFRYALESMYESKPQLGSDGIYHELDGNTYIRPAEGLFLYDLVRSLKPLNTLEIGLAYGFSTLYILAALMQNGGGQHTAIDPIQTNYWNGIGASQASRLGMKQQFSFLEEKSVPALVHFADQGRKFELIFIDGNHRFDDVLVDFTLSAELCPIGGYIVCDDPWLPAINRVIAFLRANRMDFEYEPSPGQQAAAFYRKTADSRSWNHFNEFSAFDRMTGAYRRHAPRFLQRSFWRLRYASKVIDRAR